MAPFSDNNSSSSVPGRDLVRLFLDGHRPQRQSRVRGPRADQVQRPQALRLARRAAGGLAVEGDDTPLQGLLQRGGPADQTGRELPGVDQTQHATERVVCRKTVRQLEELLQPHAPTDREGLHGDEVVGPAQHRQNGDADHVDQQGLTTSRNPHIRDLVNTRAQRFDCRPIHGLTPSLVSKSPREPPSRCHTQIDL